jgi:hypothetical protein
LTRTPSTFSSVGARAVGHQPIMIWFFERGSEQARVVTRFDAMTNEFVLDVIEPDGSCISTRFRDQAAFEQRVNALERELAAASWVQVRVEVSPPPWRGPMS